MHLLYPICQAIKSEADGEKDAAGGPSENGKKEGEAGAGNGAASQAPEGAAAGDAMEQDGEEEEEENDEEAAAAMMPIRGPLPPQDGSWASCIRLLDPVEGATVECLELGEGEVIPLFYVLQQQAARADYYPRISLRRHC